MNLIDDVSLPEVTLTLYDDHLSTLSPETIFKENLDAYRHAISLIYNDCSIEHPCLWLHEINNYTLDCTIMVSVNKKFGRIDFDYNSFKTIINSISYASIIQTLAERYNCITFRISSFKILEVQVDDALHLTAVKNEVPEGPTSVDDNAVSNECMIEEEPEEVGVTFSIGSFVEETSVKPTTHEVVEKEMVKKSIQIDVDRSFDPALTFSLQIEAPKQVSHEDYLKNVFSYMKVPLILYAPPNSGKTTFAKNLATKIRDTDDIRKLDEYGTIWITNVHSILKYAQLSIGILPSRSEFKKRCILRNLRYIDAWYDNAQRDVLKCSHAMLTNMYVTDAIRTSPPTEAIQKLRAYLVFP